jgi:hypothetical protein
MALPKLETPTYQTTIPSTGKLIEYRPFLVKEEKILMMAQETQDPAQAMGALKRIISACTFDKVNPNELTTYDAEFLFLQLRIKSVGETAKFQLPCEGCKELQDVEVDLQEVEVKFPKDTPNKDIKITDKIGIILKELTLADAIGMSGTDMEDISSMVALVIDSIYDDDKSYPANTVSRQELVEFVDQLNHTQLDEIQKFISSQPAVEKIVAFGCNNKTQGCNGCKTEVTMRGLADFFA